METPPRTGARASAFSVVQRIVTDHGGEVSFASRPGSTVFTVRLAAEPAQSML
jgi:nitrogen-specific signal transduction histidine kinase